MKITAFALALVAGVSTPVLAQSVTTQLPPVDVDTASGVADDSGAVAISREEIARHGPSTSDTAAILARLPGVSGNTGGGFSTMPAIRGLTEQRLTVLVDGHPIDSACPNDMNTPLSYTDPQTVASVAVITGFPRSAPGAMPSAGSSRSTARRPGLPRVVACW